MRMIWSAVATLSLALLSPGLARASDSFWAQATFIKGNVKATTAAAPEPARLTLGAVLHMGDRVEASEGGSASFLLNDGSILVVRGGSGVTLGKNAKGSGPTLEAVAKNLSKTLLSREGNNPMLKHLGGLRGAGRNLAVAPMRTKIRSGGARLVWLPNPGTTQFLVTVMGPGDSLFESTVRGTFLDLPAEKLVPAATYYWEVRDVASKDSITSLGSGSFSTLEKSVEDDIRSIEAKIASAFPGGATPDDSTPLFLSYQIYREKGLNLDALRVLQKMIFLDPVDPELLRWRGELCKDLGILEQELPLLAVS